MCSLFITLASERRKVYLTFQQVFIVAKVAKVAKVANAVAYVRI